MSGLKLPVLPYEMKRRKSGLIPMGSMDASKLIMIL